MPQRKRIRLQNYDYNSPGYYFVTVCVKEKRKLLGEIVGTGLTDGPKQQLSRLGQIADQQLKVMSEFYNDVHLEKYVIMPNHVHLLICITGMWEPEDRTDGANSRIAKFIGTFKRFTNKKCGMDIWQSRSHDHVIRGERDYQRIWQYIEENPLRWLDDCFYME